MTTPSAPSPSEQTPVCPRHPDRVSYVRCQRCERPACAECQRPAAVGVHCVDCVRAAQRAAPRTRTAFGAPVRDGRPVVTLILIGVNVVSFVLQLVAGAAWSGALAFVPALGAAEPWRFLTTAFLHSPSLLMHIIFNMVALWFMGPYLEHSLGRARFIALYLLSALGGSVMMLLIAAPVPGGGWLTPVVGASGAVFGLFGAVFLLLRRLGRDARQIVVIVAINAVIGFLVPRVAWEAHLGGLLVGALLGLAYAYAPRRHRSLVGVAATVGVAVVLAALAVAKYAAVGASTVLAGV